MLLPFTRDQLYGLFADYNESTWPMPALAGALGAFAVVWLIRRRKSASMIVTATLAAMWLWTGIVFHIVYFARIDWLAYLFGLAFIAQGALFLYYGFRRRGLAFGLSGRIDTALGFIFMFYAAIAYPVIGMVLGHSYPALPVFGTAPCPVTIFTFGMLLLTTERVTLVLLVVPFAWSLIGGAAAIFLDVGQDLALPVCGLIAGARLLQRDRALR